MTNYYDKVKQFIDHNPQLLLAPKGLPASDEVVTRLEKELDIKFSGEYLQFIQTWGSITLAGGSRDYFAIYRWQGRDIYWVIDESQYCWQKGLRHNLIPIFTIDSAEHYYLDPSIDGDQAVYRWDTHFNEILGKLSDSLFELIWREIEEQVIPNATKEGKQVNL